MVIELGLKFGEIETVLRVFNYLEEKHFEKFFSNSDEVSKNFFFIIFNV